MSLDSKLKTAWTSAVSKIKSKRLLQNYPNDVIAGNLSRTPVYCLFDNAILGVEDSKVFDSALNALKISAAGYGLVYILGNSVVSESFGDFYNKHSKLVDGVYSSTITFAFGMAVNSMAGYTLGQAIAASSVRSALAFPLGPVTRYYTDSFREIRNEKPLMKETNFKDKPLSYSLPRAAAMVSLPLALFFGTLEATPNKHLESISSSKELFCENPFVTNFDKKSTYVVSSL